MKKLLILLLALGLIYTLGGCAIDDRTAPTLPTEELQIDGETTTQEETHEDEGLEEAEYSNEEKVYVHSEVPEPPSIEPSIVRIANASNEFFGDFSALHEFDYSLVQDSESDWNILLWSDVPMRNFSIIKVSLDFTESVTFVSVMDVWTTADEILPGEAIVINSYLGACVIPASGFSFVDETGEKRYFTFIGNSGYPYEPGPYRWLIKEFNGTTGQMMDSLMTS